MIDETKKAEDKGMTMSPRWLQFAVMTALAGMLLLLAWASINGNFLAEGGILVSLPWGLVTLADIYTGLLLICCWVIMRERNLGISLPWCLSLLLLGNVATCLYLLRCIHQSSGHLPWLMLGRHDSILSLSTRR